jgi:hypothetical protein
MQNIRGQENADGRICDDGDPTRCYGPKDERKAHESSNDDSLGYKWFGLLRRLERDELFDKGNGKKASMVSF